MIRLGWNCLLLANFVVFFAALESRHLLQSEFALLWTTHVSVQPRHDQFHLFEFRLFLTTQKQVEALARLRDGVFVICQGRCGCTGSAELVDLVQIDLVELSLVLLDGWIFGQR